MQRRIMGEQHGTAAVSSAVYRARHVGKVVRDAEALWHRTGAACTIPCPKKQSRGELRG